MNDSANPTRRKSRVPIAMRVQVAKLFGSSSRYASAEMLADSDWKRVLLRVLAELDRYMAENVDTDAFHALMLHSGLYAAHESLKGDDFWPGYVEGITRFALLLMGDYPDHKRRGKGRKPVKHYRPVGRAEA